MLIVFDTNILIDISKGNEKILLDVQKTVSENEQASLGIAWVTYHEFLMGIHKRELLPKAYEILESYEFLPMDKNSTEIFTALKKQKTKASDFDLLIASSVIANDGLLLTRDRNFGTIKTLKVQILP